MIRDLGERLEANGRSLADIDILAMSMSARYTPGAPQEFLDALGQPRGDGRDLDGGPLGRARVVLGRARRSPPVRRGSDREDPLSAQSVFTDNAGVRIHALDNERRRHERPAGRRRARHGGVGRGVRLAPDELGNRRVVIVDVRGRGQSDAPEHGLPVGRPLRRPRGDGGGARGSTGRSSWRSRAARRTRWATRSRTPAQVRGLVIGDYWARHVGLPPEFGERQLAVVLRGVPMSERMPAHAVARCRAGESRGPALGSAAESSSSRCS